MFTEEEKIELNNKTPYTSSENERNREAKREREKESTKNGKDGASVCETKTQAKLAK